MHSIFCIMLVCFTIATAGAQDGEVDKMSVDDLRSLVEMVDDELDLDNRQEKELLFILKTSYDQLVAVQKSDKTDVEKLQLIRQNQLETDRSLQSLMTVEQYSGYRRFVHGDQSRPGPLDYSGRVNLIADDLDLEGDKRDEFVANLLELESSTKQILSSGQGESAGLDLLTAILVSDVELIGIIGKSGYEQYHLKREAGALSGSASGSHSDIETVLMFYDVAQALELKHNQTEGIIRMILENETAKQTIRQQYGNSQALLEEQLLRHEQSALIRLQSILTDKQVKQLLDMIGG